MVLEAGLTTAAEAQPIARRTGAVVISPEVTADRRVTFRLPAPDAKVVTVSRDFGPDPELRNGDDGVWSVTIGPLDSEMYVYYFIVDGVRLTDPNNSPVKIGYVPTTTTSVLVVPSPNPRSMTSRTYRTARFARSSTGPSRLA